MPLTTFRLDVDADGVALATWDMPGRSMNVITPDVMADLAEIVERVASDAAIKGCVVTSGKETLFRRRRPHDASGSRRRVRPTREGEAATRRRCAFFFDGIAKTVAALSPARDLRKAFRGGRARHLPRWRVRARARLPPSGAVGSDEATKVGLPEIKVGLFPGAGGTQRVSRLMQTADALQMLFRGDQIRPQMAKGMGLAHEVAPRADIVAKAKAWILAGGSAVAPWDEPKFRAPSGKVYSPAGMMTWPPANAIYRRETHDNYPAAKAILQSVYEGLQLPFDLALRVESRYFANILRSKEAAAMIRTLFLSKGELDKGARRPKSAPATALKTIGIVGAGFMGAGIAYVTAQAGLDVVLIDRDIEAAETGKAYSQKLMSDQVAKGRAKTADRDALLARIRTSADYGDLAACDLVIEAVFEDPYVKAEVIAKVEAAIRPDCIFASNTSTLPISGLAKSSKRAGEFIGIHFFSPVDKMLLVEIIMGKQTGEVALATALDYVRAIRKTPIVVNDSRGFFANRCVLAYILEGHLMLAEGVPPAMIENLARQAGMPVGPLSLNDEVGVDLALKILKATKAQLGGDSVNPDSERILTALVEKEGRLGRKNQKGFYDYPPKGQGRKALWPGLADLQPTRLAADTLDRAEIEHRLLVIQALEAARTVEEGVVTDPREADVGSVLGFGFAPFTGGALSYIDGMGAGAFVALAGDLEAKHGPRFSPPKILVDMADSGGMFYGAAHKRAA